MSKLEVKNISFSYDNENNVLDDVSFSLTENDFLVILGASGDGKTTLLKIISGLLIQDKGDIIFNDKIINDLFGRERSISYIFQENFLYSHMTIYQNLLIGFKKQKISDEEKDIKIKQILKLLKITKFINLKPKHLSLGERQKISIAKSLLSNDEIYLFDEPFSAIDLQNKNNLLLYLKNSHKEKKKPFIYVTHEQEDAYKIATHILILKKGKVLQFGTINDVNSNPLYLEVRDYFGEKLNVFDIDINKDNMVLCLNKKFVLDKKVNFIGKALIGIEISNFSIIEKECDNSFVAQYIDSFFDNNGRMFARVNVNNKEIIVKQENDQSYEKNSYVNVSFENDYYLFDKITHKNLCL